MNRPKGGNEMKDMLIRDKYNSLKWWMVKRDKNYHYYVQQFIGISPQKWYPSSKQMRIRKRFLESVLERVIVF